MPLGARVCVRPLPHDGLPMPPQDRVGCDDARDLPQDPPAQSMPMDRQPTSIVIRELKPLATQLASKDPIFFHEIRDRLAFLAIQPASQNGKHLYRGRVDHGSSLCHPAKFAAPSPSVERWDTTGFNRERLFGASARPHDWDVSE